MDFLVEIMKDKRRELKATQQTLPLAGVRAAGIEARRRAKPHALSAALQREGINIIAEFKRRSPSKGWIREDADAATNALNYQEGGAAAVSVLTEMNRFGGTLEDLRAVRAAVSIPVLRKDFIINEYQVYESAAAGADALLLIVAALREQELRRLFELTENELGMDALVEVHTKKDLECATRCGAKIIGVNNRDLRTFQVSIDTSFELMLHAPEDAILVSESGLTPGAIKRLRPEYKGFLVGEQLMRARDSVKKLRAYREEK